GEVRRRRIKTHANKILVTPGGQSIDDRGKFDRPVFFGGENDRPGAADGPGASDSRFFPLGLLCSRLTGPAMMNDIEIEAGRISHIRFEGQGLLLLAPAAEGPLHGHWSRQ